MRLILAFLIVLASTSMACTHDEWMLSDWIGNSQIKNSKGEFCCGQGDCVPIPATQIKIVPQGFYLPNAEIVPFSEAQYISRDGFYWRCHRPDGTRRCFLAPPNST